MNKQIEVGYNLHWSAYVRETINITNEFLRDCDLDENSTNEEIIEALTYNMEYLQGYMDCGIPIDTNTVVDVTNVELDADEIEIKNVTTYFDVA